jgi:putative flippase GtrA
MRRLARYAVVSAGGSVVQMAAIWMLTALADVPAVTATAVAVAAALVHNFTWHRRWTWRDRPLHGWDVPRGFGRYVLANGLVSILGNLCGAILLVDVAGSSPVLANGVAIVLCGVVNFRFANRIWMDVSRGAPARVIGVDAKGGTAASACGART